MPNVQGRLRYREALCCGKDEVHICRIYVLTAVVMNSTSFWGITPCNPLKVNRSFGRTYRLRIQGRSINREIYKHKSRWQAEQSAGRNFGLYRKPEGNGIVELSSCWYLALKMEAICSTETSVDFQRTTRRYISEHRTLHSFNISAYIASCNWMISD
jgi:hypothetical protein